MLRILQQPYPIYESSRARWRMSLLFGLFVFLFLWLFEPVGFNEIPKNKGWHALGYGLVCTLTMLFVNVSLVKIFPQFFEENCWTTGRQIALTMANVGLIGLGNVLYTRYAFNQLGLSAGWDIRPDRLQRWYLRTSLRYFPGMKLKLPDGSSQRVDQLEVNFIQLVVLPGRFK